jgi:AcrR family transcriptional regulator
VLEEAARQLNGRGVSQTSLVEIAERLGVSRAALYYYFDDQQELVFETYRRTCEAMVRRLDEAERAGGDAIAAIGSFVDGMLARNEPEFAAMGEAAYLRPGQRDTIASLYDSVLRRIAGILDDGAARGQLRACAAPVVAQAVIGLISWAPMVRRWRSSEAVSGPDLVEAIKSLLACGVARRRSEPLAYRPFDLAPPAAPLGQVFDASALAAARQEALLAAASWLFNLKGVDATSLEEIARTLGVTKRVVYHNVGDKGALVTACYRRSFRFHDGVAECLARYQGTRVDAFCASTHANAEASLREDMAPLAPLVRFEVLPAAVRDEMQLSGQRLLDRYLGAFAAGRAEGSIRALDAGALLAVHPGLFQWLPKWFDTLTQSERSTAPRELADLTYRGLLLA